MPSSLQAQNGFLARSIIRRGTRSSILNQSSRLLIVSATKSRTNNGIVARIRPQQSSHQWRRLSTTEKPAVDKLTTPSTPPLIVRTALVATTTAIGTPAFPVVGVVNFGLRYVVWDSQTRYAILGATTLVGAVGTLIHFATFDLLPIAYSYGQLFLPFAIVNGSLAGTAYLVLDSALGTAAVASLPWTGAAMGAFVGLVGPVSGLYDHAFQWFYDIPEADGWFSYLLNNSIMLPISTATGAAVGFVMKPLLYYPIVGIPGVHWAKFSLPLLVAATGLVGHLYYADYFNDSIFPPETYLTEEEKRGLLLVPRFRPRSLQVEDWGAGLGYNPTGTGNRARESVRSKLETTRRGDSRTDMVFDSRRKAWLHYVTGGAFGEDVNLESIPSQIELNQQAQKLLSSDGAVAFIMLEGASIHKNQNDTSEMVRKGLTQLAIDLQASKSLYKRDRRGQKAKRTVDRIELASRGIAILLTEHRQNGIDADTGIGRDGQLKRLERDIRKLVPGIILYTKEETEQTKGCSVESQLEAFGWDGLKDDQLKQRLRRRWKSGVHQFRSAEQAEANAKKMGFAVTGLALVLAYGLFGTGYR